LVSVFGGQINASIIRNPGGNLTLEEYLRTVSNTFYFQTNSAADLLSLGLNNTNFRSASSVSMGSGSNANASAQLDVSSTTKGFLPPRMTTTQKNAIASPATGLVVMDITTLKLCVYNGSSWVDLH
jgi:hypothetical protein